MSAPQSEIIWDLTAMIFWPKNLAIAEPGTKICRSSWLDSKVSPRCNTPGRAEASISHQKIPVKLKLGLWEGDDKEVGMGHAKLGSRWSWACRWSPEAQTGAKTSWNGPCCDPVADLRKMGWYGMFQGVPVVLCYISCRHEPCSMILNLLIWYAGIL